MATGDYCTLRELKAYIWPDNSTPDEVNDTQLARLIAGFSKQFREKTGTRWHTTTADETRYLSAYDFNTVRFPFGIISLTSLATDQNADRTWSTAWTTADYELCPLSAALDGRPYTSIRTKPGGDYGFPSAREAVKAVGKFGWSSSTTPENTPGDVKELLLLQCQRVFLRRNAPFGTLGPTELGQVAVIPRIDPDIAEFLISTYQVNLT